MHDATNVGTFFFIDPMSATLRERRMAPRLMLENRVGCVFWIAGTRMVEEGN